MPHLVVAVNKMDLVDWSEGVFTAIRDEFTAFAAARRPRRHRGAHLRAGRDNVVTASQNMPWWTGPSLLHHLEEVEVAGDANVSDARFPVQYVIRPQSDAHRDYRGYAGSVASGVLRVGDAVQVLPSGRTTTIEGIDGPAGPSTSRSRRWR